MAAIINGQIRASQTIVLLLSKADEETSLIDLFDVDFSTTSFSTNFQENHRDGYAPTQRPA